MNKRLFKDLMIVLIFISFFISTKLKSQTAMDSLIALSENAISTGNDVSARLVLHKILYSGDSSWKVQAYKRLASIETVKGKYYKASDYYLKALNCSSSIDMDLVFDYLYSLMLNQQYDLALIELGKYEQLLKSKCLDRYYFFKGSLLLLDGNREEAKTAFDSLSIYTDSSLQYRIDSIFNSATKPKNVLKTKILSGIVPGSGQIYCNDYANGIKSFTINSGFLSLSYYIASQYTVLNALTSSFPWFLRYYRSGIIKSGEIAKEYNHKKNCETLLYLIEQ